MGITDKDQTLAGILAAKASASGQRGGRMAPGTTTGRDGRGGNRGGNQGTGIFKEHSYLVGKEYLNPSSMTPENVPECIDAMMERKAYCKEHVTIMVMKA